MSAAPCGIHDSRLRELESEQASQQSQLSANSSTLNSIHGSIGMLSDHVRDAMSRVENTVNRVADDVKALSSQVSELRIEQVVQKNAVEEISKQHTDEAKILDDRKSAIKNFILKALGIAIALIGASVAGANGKNWLETFFKTIAGG